MPIINHLRIYLFLVMALLFISPQTTTAQPLAELIYLPIDTIQQLDTKPIAKTKKQRLKKAPKSTKDKGGFGFGLLISFYLSTFIVGLILFCVSFPLGLLTSWIIGLGLEGLFLILTTIFILFFISGESFGENWGGTATVILLIITLALFLVANGITFFIIGLGGFLGFLILGISLFLLGLASILLIRLI